MYYSATLFKEIGFNQPTVVGLIVSGTSLVHALRTKVLHRHHRASPYPSLLASLVDAWHDLWSGSGERRLPLYAFVLIGGMRVRELVI